MEETRYILSWNDISEWTIIIEFEFLLSLWFSSCCSCCWKLQHQHYIHSTSYILCWSLNILPVISASKIANTEVPALSNARSETSVRVACCCAAVVLLCCCAAVAPHQLLPVKLLPSVRAELRWVGEADKYKYIVGRVFVCCLSFLNRLTHPAHVVISTQKCGGMSLAAVMCSIYNIYTIYTIFRTPCLWWQVYNSIGCQGTFIGG